MDVEKFVKVRTARNVVYESELVRLGVADKFFDVGIVVEILDLAKRFVHFKELDEIRFGE